MNEAAMRKRVTDFVRAIEDETVDLVPIMPLDWAWGTVVDALPTNWTIDELKRADIYMLPSDGNGSTWDGDHWTVTARDRENFDLSKTGTGRTPAEALIRLSEELEEAFHAAASRT